MDLSLDAMAGPTVQHRGFDDVAGQRSAIYDSVFKAVQAKFPMQNATHRLELDDLKYDDYNPTKADEKKAILGDGRMHRALRGTVRLVDINTNKVLDQQPTVLAHVPHLTNRGTFILNGTSWLVRNQARLRPGVYVRRQKSGGTEAHFNVKNGRGYRIEMEPESGVFKLNVGQSTTKLYPLMRALGVPDDQIKEAWGEELYNKNYRTAGKNDLHDLKKVVTKFGRPDTVVQDDTAAAVLKELIAKSETDEDTTELTLGKRIKNISPDVWLHATKKILGVARGDVDEDNRDSQSYQSIHSAEDFFAERIKKDPIRNLGKILWKASKDNNLGSMKPGALTPNLHALFNGTGLAATPEETNPLEVADLRYGITRMGEGGISDTSAVSRDARGVQPSYVGLVDPNRSPESLKIGLDMRAAVSALKGSDNQLYAQVRNVKTGLIEKVPSRKLETAPLAFPGELKQPGKRVRAVVGSQIKYVNRDDVAYELPSGADMLSPVTLMVPFPQAMKGQRLAMASRMTAQALPLKDGEAPHVQGALQDGTSMHDRYAEAVGAVKSGGAGRVLKVTPDEIVVQHADGRKSYDIYNNLPGARKTVLHNTPVVKVGDTVTPGQLLAKSNYTDHAGKVAIGKNLRVGYMVAKGLTHEDGYVLSESAAKKLTSEQAYQMELDHDGIKSTKKADYTAVYGPRFTKEQYANLDDDGLVKVGTVVKAGDPLILAIGQKADRALGAIMKLNRSPVADKSVMWEHEGDGEVVDIRRSKAGTSVVVKTHTPVQIGDKTSGRHGNKGVVTSIVPDAQMPHDSQGRPLEVILNAAGVVGRINPSVLIESLLGKVADKTGKPYVIPAFGHDNAAEFALAEAAKHGVPELETVTDSDGRKIPNIFVGNQYIMKLHHLAESKMSARDTATYDSYDAPAKGGYEGSKRISGLDIASLLSSGATNFLKDAKLVRGQRNDDYWRAVKTGSEAQAPARTFANNHFKALLKSAGVNIREEGTKQRLRPMLDSDVSELAQHEIENGETFDFTTMKPVPGGLFDLTKTGGADGTRFSKITLPAKIPHPLFFEPIARVLGLTLKGMEEVLAGKTELYGKKGPEAIEHALSGLNIDKEMERHKVEVRSGSASNRDSAVRALGFLQGFKNMGIQPKDLMISKIPVLPPKYRPIARTPTSDVTHDMNYLYHDLLQAKQNYTDHDSKLGEAGQQYLTMYKAAKAVIGTGSPINPKHQEQELRGLLGFAIGVGESPKGALFQRRVMGTALDTVGRSVITIDPSLKMDEVSMPKQMAWDTFRPFIIRRLVRSGMKAADAVLAVKNQTKAAELALKNEMAVRPVVYNRAPALHRYAYVGAYAKLNDSNSIAINNAVMTGLGADFDGDSGRFILEIDIRNMALESWQTYEGEPMPVAALNKLASAQPIHIQDMPVVPNSAVEKNATVTEYDVPAGVEVYALDPKTGEHRLYPVTKFSVHRDLDMYHVRVGKRFSHDLFVSSDHSLICYKAGEITQVKPSEAMGLMVPVIKRMAMPAKQTKVTAHDSLTWERGADTCHSTHSAEVQLTRKLGFFIGALVGDGWVSACDSMCLSNDDKDVRDGFISAACECTPATSTGQVCTWTGESLGGVFTERNRVTANSAWFARWLRTYVGTGAINKKIPSWSLSGPEDHLLGVLDGLLSTDGCVSVNNGASRGSAQLAVSFTSISMDLLNGLQYLLKRLGVQSTITPSRVTQAGNQAYILSLSSPDFLRMVETTKFTLTAANKQRVLSANTGLVNYESAVVASTDLVPYPSHLHAIMLELARTELSKASKSKSAGDVASAAASAAKKAGCVSRVQARKYIEAGKKLGLGNPQFIAWAKLVEDTAVTWKRVEEVTAVGKQDGYDLTVPGAFTFATADGVIVQDTINVHVPSSEEAVQDIKDKLLPSKNLWHAGTFDVHHDPKQDYIAGLYLATQRDDSKPVKEFATEAEAIKAYARGEISARDPVRILSSEK